MIMTMIINIITFNFHLHNHHHRPCTTDASQPPSLSFVAPRGRVEILNWLPYNRQVLAFNPAQRVARHTSRTTSSLRHDDAPHHHTSPSYITITHHHHTSPSHITTDISNSGTKHKRTESHVLLDDHKVEVISIPKLHNSKWCLLHAACKV